MQETLVEVIKKMDEDVKLIKISNWDYPSWDHATLTAGVTETQYVVGTNNVATRAIKKLFTSKETLVIATADTYIRFNYANAVQHYLLADVPYTFRTNIFVVYVQRVGQEDTTVYIDFEGTQPQETRVAE